MTDKAARIKDAAQRLAQGVAGNEHGVGRIHRRMRSTIEFVLRWLAAGTPALLL